MRVRHLLLGGALIVAACGGGGTDDTSPTSPPPGSEPSAPTAVAPTTAPPDSAAPATTAPPATTPATTTLPTTTPVATVEPSEPAAGDAVLLGPPNPQLVAAAPPEQIDWASVGAGWLLVDHPTGVGPLTDPQTLDQRGLYLVAPDDRIFGVTALSTDGSWIAAVSDDARQVLLQTFDPVCADGCTCSGDPVSSVETEVVDGLVQREFGYVLVDLTTRTARPVIEPVTRPVCGPSDFRRDVAFTADGRGIWVSETWFTDDGWHVERVQLGRLDIESGTWAPVIDRTLDRVDVAAATSPSLWELSVVDLGDDRIAIGTPDGTWLTTAAGDPIRQLADPGTPCHLLGSWDGEHVLARCVVPAGIVAPPAGVPPEQCRPAGLWLVALDGSPARQLAIRQQDGVLECWASYTAAVRLDGSLALQVSGDGATDGVDLVGPTGDVTAWMPPDIADSFTESLLGIRGGTWLIQASNEWGDTGLYEATTESSTRIDLPAGRVIVL